MKHFLRVVPASLLAAFAVAAGELPETAPAGAAPAPPGETSAPFVASRDSTLASASDGSRGLSLTAEEPLRWDFGVSVGNGWGMKSFGSFEAHDLAMMFVGAGWRLTAPPDPHALLGGTLDLRAELCAGYQYHPEPAYIVGLAPMLRYNFWTRSAFMPFIELGVGVNATDIGEPDLSTVFEFSPQGGVGLKYFASKRLAITAEFRFLHLSNAGLRQPNEGVNTGLVLVGLNWFF